MADYSLAGSMRAVKCTSRGREASRSRLLPLVVTHARPGAGNPCLQKRGARIDSGLASSRVLAGGFGAVDTFTQKIRHSLDQGLANSLAQPRKTLRMRTAGLPFPDILRSGLASPHGKGVGGCQGLAVWGGVARERRLMNTSRLDRTPNPTPSRVQGLGAMPRKQTCVCPCRKV